ncbi:transporter substrate-binding domain-containing protein [Paraburkholderia sp. BL10I2N1]|uniref:transglycosylase SLT domain-containing protein n=1 Tax=Paraburkholderia sp. BL10I2N1 TaxID=1938796 RepID=UPI0010620C1F|nr:transporter substrate-binding domain-containing protein [Paraburkholderia sp. BL10I2N1]TDN70144.1 membrane-bound lytic murein transglycosylase MltF [Paraburkholderia sp. BL10I2N1]
MSFTPMFKLFVCLAYTIALLGEGSAGAAQHPVPASATRPAPVRQLSVPSTPWQGDFNAMLERRQLRVLVPYSRTLYFIDKGHERGLTAELMRDFERYINKTYSNRLGKRPFTVFLIPTTRDRLLPDLNAGLGDIAAGNLTVTDERLKLVDFFAPPNRKPVSELVVTGPQSPQLATLDDMAGKTVHVRRSSSYYESLTALDRQLRASGKPPLKIVLLPDALEDEDALEMLNTGLLQILVVDDWKARLWAQVLPNIRVHDNLAVRTEGYTGWAMRKNSPQLREAMADFFLKHAKRQGIEEYRLERYMRHFKQIRNNDEVEALRRFEQTVAVFQIYGRQYGFDPLMLAAQGFQESQLKQSARSRAGAVGIMQITPATGREMNVGSIMVTESNIHAGAKYMDQLMTRYFPDAHFSENDRSLFAFASYNAGPSKIAGMREEALQLRLDPDKWFNNVEIVVAERIGMETPTYVRNVYKYYVSYRLVTEAQAARTKAVGTVRR